MQRPLLPFRGENALGPVAQLNRVSDSGSEGSGFEPQRDHKNRQRVLPVFYFNFISTMIGS